MIVSLLKEEYEAERLLALQVIVSLEVFVGLMCAGLYLCELLFSIDCFVMCSKTGILYPHNKFKLRPDVQLELLDQSYRQSQVAEIDMAEQYGL